MDRGRRRASAVVVFALLAGGLALVGSRDPGPRVDLEAPTPRLRSTASAPVTAAIAPSSVSAPVARDASSSPCAVPAPSPGARVRPPASASPAPTSPAYASASPASPASASPPEHVEGEPAIHSTWLPEAMARQLDRAGEAAIREVARRAIPAAAQLMRARNPGAGGLDPALKDRLRPTFGDLVDRVLVCEDANFPDQTLHTEGADALTIGDRIYLRGALRADDPVAVRRVAHELVHVRQFERFDRDLDAFSAELGRQLAAARWDEEQTEFEREADGLVLEEGRRGGVASALGVLADGLRR